MRSAEEFIASGGVGVLPTDTVYGVVGSALHQEAIERMYRLMKRDSEKPFIVLIQSISELSKFEVAVDDQVVAQLSQFWPGPVSIALPCRSENLRYLHRGGYSIAFRVPDDAWLTELLQKTGPLATSSANPQGLPVPSSVQEARKYFGNKLDFYVDGGSKSVKPSKLLRIDSSGTVKVLRD